MKIHQHFPHFFILFSPKSLKSSFNEQTKNIAQALVEMGDTLKQMADVKYSLDDNVKQNFLEPLHQLQMKDLKEVMVSLHTREIIFNPLFLIPLLMMSFFNFPSIIARNYKAVD